MVRCPDIPTGCLTVPLKNAISTKPQFPLRQQSRKTRPLNGILICITIVHTEIIMYTSVFLEPLRCRGEFWGTRRSGCRGSLCAAMVLLPNQNTRKPNIFVSIQSVCGHFRKIRNFFAGLQRAFASVTPRDAAQIEPWCAWESFVESHVHIASSLRGVCRKLDSALCCTRPNGHEARRFACGF